jgi:hypothetical protein
MRRKHLSTLGCLWGLLAAGLLLAACTNVAIPRPAPQPIPLQPSDRQILAGEWEYVDGAVFLLTLDKQGNGHYEWKDGRFETQALIGHTWHGMWLQKENDRDGRFTVELSPDFSEGEGRWWYSRIETDHAPTQKGGTFHLTRKDSRANVRDTPPAP